MTRRRPVEVYLYTTRLPDLSGNGLQRGHVYFVRHPDGSFLCHDGHFRHGDVPDVLAEGDDQPIGGADPLQVVEDAGNLNVRVWSVSLCDR